VGAMHKVAIIQKDTKDSLMIFMASVLQYFHEDMEEWEWT
jgi:hypothetical protein